MLFLHALCLGIVEAEERADLWDSAIAEVNRELLRGTVSVRVLLGVVWRVMRPPVRQARRGHASRWDWRRACERLFDVPVHAAMVAIPVGVGTAIVTAAVGLPSVSMLAGLVAGLGGLVIRSLYMVNREIRARRSQTYMAQVSLPSARIITAANVITLFRLVPIGMLVPILVDRKAVAATVLLSLAAIGDFVDGYVARRFSQETARGKLFDPCVDRLVVILAGVGLIASGHEVSLLVEVPLVLVVIRDIAVVLLGITFYRLDRSPIPNHKGHIASILGFTGVIAAYATVATEVTQVLAVNIPTAVTLVGSFFFGVLSFREYQRDITAGRTRRRGEDLVESPPADKLRTALRRLPEGLYETHRSILVEIAAHDPSGEKPLTELVQETLAGAKRDLASSHERGHISRVDEFEELIGYLDEILRRLS